MNEFAPTLPTTPPPSFPTDEAPQPELTTPGFTLDDAVDASTSPEEQALAAESAPPMTAEQIIGAVAEISAIGLPVPLASAYKDDFKQNGLVQLGVQLSGLPEALAQYGIGAGGGQMPAWLSLVIGVSVLGYGVYSTRSKYVQATRADDPFAEFRNADVPDVAAQTNLGWASAGNQGGGGAGFGATFAGHTGSDSFGQ